uniref:Tripartite motif-containing protein 35-like n=1 Tax=Sinocyclocheilus grahami TaxID=75366 RepID=A0A672MGT0_SINGR
MTSRSFSEEDLICPVCREIFIDPVLLSCTHSFCRYCLQRSWGKQEHKACPLCRRRVSKEAPLNLNLRNLCEAYQEERRRKSSIGDEAVCSLHKEKLRLFCLDDQQAVCLVCRDSRKHTNHKFCPIDEALTDNKEKLQDLLNHLQEKLIKFEDFKENLNKSAKHIKAQAQCTEKQIKAEFQKLHQLLHDEEAIRITALREEEKQKSQKMIDKIEETSKQIVYLTRTIRDTEEQMKAGDDSFLRNTLKRGQHGLSDPENVSEMLIDVPKHLSNLKFTVLQKMQEYIKYTPVTLDPNTAHCTLLVSDDLTSVRFRDEEKLLPDNLERFDSRECVLGSEGFDSGLHCWDIEVGDLTNWTFGVMTESAQRKDDILTKKGLWVLGYASGEYYAFVTPEQSPPLSVKNKLQKIRVQLNYEKGKLSFINPLNNAYIHTFTQKFTEKVYPWFGVRCDICPLVILPVI